MAGEESPLELWVGQARMFLHLTFEGHRHDMVLLRWYNTENSVPSQVTRLQRVKWATISGNRPHYDVVDASRITFPMTSCLTPPPGPTGGSSTPTSRPTRSERRLRSLYVVRLLWTSPSNRCFPGVCGRRFTYASWLAA